jgi:hypothetical protein
LPDPSLSEMVRRIIQAVLSDQKSTTWHRSAWLNLKHKEHPIK